MSNLLDNLVGLEENMLYDDISKTESKIVNELFNIFKWGMEWCLFRYSNTCFIYRW